MSRDASQDDKIKEQNRRLLDAAEFGDTLWIKECLENGADVNTRNEYKETPLIVAASHGDLWGNVWIGAVKLLIKNGADVNARMVGNGTALMLAANRGYSVVVKLLIEKGADINAKDDNGWTALMLAANGGYIDTVRILLENRADVNVRAKDGWTALRAANGCQEIISLLKKAGAKD